MFCKKCQQEKIGDPSEKSWCSDCRKAARDVTLAFRSSHPLALYGGRSYASRNLILKEIGFSSYSEYLRSDLWKQIRARVFACKGKNCAICFRPASSIHHNRYHKNDLLGKTLKFVRPVCDGCHHDLEFTIKGEKVCLAEAKNRFDKKARIRKRARKLINVASLLLNFDADQ